MGKRLSVTGAHAQRATQPKPIAASPAPAKPHEGELRDQLRDVFSRVQLPRTKLPGDKLLGELGWAPYIAVPPSIPLPSEPDLYALKGSAGQGLETVAGPVAPLLREALAKLPPSATTDDLVRWVNGTFPDGAVASHKGSGVKATLADVTWLLCYFPKELGVEGFVDRHHTLQKLAAQALDGAAPKGGLHAVAHAVADAYNAQATGLEKMKPGDAEEWMLGRDEFQNAAYRLNNANPVERLERVRAEVLDTVDPKNDSIAEMMKKCDDEAVEGCDEKALRTLFLHFPVEMGFGGASIAKAMEADSTGEPMFWLAQQVAHAMVGTFGGATLDDVAQFLKTSDPRIAKEYPDLSGQDVALLQRAYADVPQWTVSPGPDALLRDPRAQLTQAFASISFSLGTKGVTDALVESVMNELLQNINAPDLGARVSAEVNDVFTRAAAYAIAQDCVRQVPQAQAAKLLPDVLAALGDGSSSEVEVINRLEPLAKKLRSLNVYAVANAMSRIGAGQFASASKIMQLDPDLQNKLSQLGLAQITVPNIVQGNVLANKELLASLQRYSVIRKSGPLTDLAVDLFKDKQPFKNTNVLFVQHLLGQAVSQVKAYERLGLDPKNALFVAIPYQANPEVVATLQHEDNIDVRLSKKDVDDFKAEIHRGIDEMVKKQKENGEKVLVVCDGPEAREYFAQNYPELTDRFVFTEQTAFGDREKQHADTSMRVVSYARTPPKGEEAAFVGQSLARAVSAVTQALGTSYEKKPVLVMGMGSIGRASAEALNGHGGEVSVYDPNLTADQEAWAKDHGVTVIKDAAQITKGKFLLVGASGYLSLGEQQILDADPDAILVSASSKQVEIDMKRLAALATDEEGRVRKVLAAEVDGQQTWKYWLANGKIVTVVADGLPGNFQGTNVVAPEHIDLTMGLSVVSGAQAVLGTEKGFVETSPEYYQPIYDAFRARLTGGQSTGREPAATLAGNEPAPA
jgi:S-adenosylhomocysteine hydrolase